MSRDSNGTYTLPSGNPVQSGTVIESDWANNTMADIANEMTDSLSRSGEGGMLAPLRHVDGSAAAPAITWITEPTSGWYRAGANDFRYSIATTDVLRIVPGAVEVWNGLSWDTINPGGALLIDGSNFMTGILRVDTANGDHARIGHGRVISGSNQVIYAYSTDGSGATQGTYGAQMLLTSNQARLQGDAAGTTTLDLDNAGNTVVGGNLYVEDINSVGVPFGFYLNDDTSTEIFGVGHIATAAFDFRAYQDSSMFFYCDNPASPGTQLLAFEITTFQGAPGRTGIEAETLIIKDQGAISVIGNPLVPLVVGGLPSSEPHMAFAASQIQAKNGLGSFADMEIQHLGGDLTIGNITANAIQFADAGPTVFWQSGILTASIGAFVQSVNPNTAALERCVTTSDIPVKLILSADSTRTSTTTPTAESDFDQQVSVPANSAIRIRAGLMVSQGGGANGGLTVVYGQANFNYTSLNKYIDTSNLQVSTGSTGTGGETAFTVAPGTLNTNRRLFEIDTILENPTGAPLAVVFEWAQQTSSATATTMFAGSWVEYTSL